MQLASGGFLQAPIVDGAFDQPEHFGSGGVASVAESGHGCLELRPPSSPHQPLTFSGIDREKGIDEIDVNRIGHAPDERSTVIGR
jgi:hypothetical protein